MEVLAPLVTATARWIDIDASLRLMWNMVGVAVLAAAIIALIIAAAFVARKPEDRRNS